MRVPTDRARQPAFRGSFPRILGAAAGQLRAGPALEVLGLVGLGLVGLGLVGLGLRAAADSAWWLIA